MFEAFQLSVHLNYVLGSGPIEDRLATARELGFPAVEQPAPYSLPAREYRNLLVKYGLHQVQLAVPDGDWHRGKSQVAIKPEYHPQFRERFKRAVEYANELGCKLVHVMSGVIEPQDREAATDCYVRNLTFAATYLEDTELRGLIEPINDRDFPGYLTNTPERALSMLDRVGSPKLGMLLDTYHAASAGTNPVAFFKANAHRIFHVQVADAPGRHEPGTGELDFNAFFAALAAGKYRGYVGLEYIPLGDVRSGMQWLSKFAREYFDETSIG